MSDEPFPDIYVDLGLRAGKQYSTTVIQTFGGREFRNINWPGGLGRWRLPLSMLTNAERDAVLAFIDARDGAGDTFLFTNPEDGSGPFRCRFANDRSEIETRYFQTHYWPDVEIKEVRE